MRGNRPAARSAGGQPDVELRAAQPGELEVTCADVTALERETLKGVVLDLRNNGGGSLTEAIELTGLFIDRGPVVQVRDAQGNWRTVIEDLGLPSGKTKTIAVDLSNKWLSASRDLRIVTDLDAQYRDATLAVDVTVRNALARVALTPEEVWSATGLAFAEPRRADRAMGEEQRRILAERVVRTDAQLAIPRGVPGSLDVVGDVVAIRAAGRGAPSAA